MLFCARFLGLSVGWESAGGTGSSAEGTGGGCSDGLQAQVGQPCKKMSVLLAKVSPIVLRQA